MVFKWRDKCTIEFLDLYRSYEYLWNNLNPLYKNRIARETAYKEIVRSLNRPYLTVRDVKKKIKTIRTNYKYELNKVLSSQMEAVHPSDVYVPHLFWFKKADEFLRDFSMGREYNNSKMECSGDEDNSEYTQSEEKPRIKSELEEFKIKLENQSLKNEEIDTGGHSDSYNSSPSPPAENFHESNSNNEAPSSNAENLNETTGTPPSQSLPSSPDNAHNSTPSLQTFTAPASVHKINGRPIRKHNKLKSHTKPGCDPLKSIELFQLAISNLQKSVDSLKNEADDEFDFFGKSIALQLKKMPLERALACQESLQKVINQERLNQNKINTNSVGT